MPKPSLKHFACGQTLHNVARVYKGVPREQRIFPAGAFLFQHPGGEKVLYDTGYAPSMAGAGLIGRLYSKLLPPEVTSHDTIDRRLIEGGVRPVSVGHVVISHLHPDHIGGVRYFPDSTFVLSEQTMDALDNHHVRDGIFPRLLPEWFADAPKVVLDNAALSQPTDTAVAGHDLLGDQSYIVTSLPGHAAGHIGAFVNRNVLLAGDASWGNDLLPHANHLRRLPRFITHDVEAYEQTARTLQTLGEQGIRLCFSHDRYPQAELL